MVNHAYDPPYGYCQLFSVIVEKRNTIYLITNYQLHILLFYVNAKYLVDYEG